MTAAASKRAIAVAGEALIDLVLDDTGAMSPHPGGGPFVIDTIGAGDAFGGAFLAGWPR